MKAAYYFSETQRRLLQNISRTPLFLSNGTEYTEILNYFEDGDEIPLQNSFSDSKLVFIKENLPVNESMLNISGKRFAKVF